MSLTWEHEGREWYAYHIDANHRKVVGRVCEDRESDVGAIGWQAYYLGDPKPLGVGSFAMHPIRRLEPVGFFHRLRDAMQHVRVLHALDSQ